ncbi:MAG TPA: TIGR03621 family F420-dependent LLM class oxidoreductase [Actinocrinis sp.]|uniref:TIGR03621 family F420-dependent LLM class oxidoreductase n=1 Tax=Actinocrinis sp. TaxID=1920516 RepID=UPI002DDDAA59|nr:TIGR03621 family F420-dependent LLM class oxidoreductase [Actinocrinis sp.]HEV2344906.1 TIGR03621 family F420-dependent LLM class oxidoreductase [Actinocrinis sp.]
MTEPVTRPARPFRFGAIVRSASRAKEWADTVRRAEDLGYSALLVSDHLDGQLAPFAALASAAALTSTIRLGSYVFAAGLRHPALLAGEAASIDVLCDGRFELGLGAGWESAEYRKLGLDFDPLPVRLEQLAEALAVVRACFAGEPFTFTGAHHRVVELSGLPRPAQSPGPRILIAGGGRRVLGFAAREADIVGLGAKALVDGTGIDLGDITAAATDRKIAWIRESAGSRWPRLELNAIVFAVDPDPDRPAAAERLAGVYGQPAAALLESPHVLLGSVDDVCDQLRERRERWGISYICVFQDDMEAFAPVVDRLAER